MFIPTNLIKDLPFQSFRKTTFVRARQLTEKDLRQRNGIIQTKEGRVSFQVGDYLARGISNEEWPIANEAITNDYKRVSEPDAEGFCAYRALNTRQALQISTTFTIQYNSKTTLNGKAGDYLVRSGDNIWITDRHIFEHTYEHA